MYASASFLIPYILQWASCIMFLVFSSELFEPKILKTFVFRIICCFLPFFAFWQTKDFFFAFWQKQICTIFWGFLLWRKYLSLKGVGIVWGWIWKMFYGVIRELGIKDFFLIFSGKCLLLGSWLPLSFFAYWQNYLFEERFPYTKLYWVGSSWFFLVCKIFKCF